jgi:hypothetical protein
LLFAGEGRKRLVQFVGEVDRAHRARLGEERPRRGGCRKRRGARRDCTSPEEVTPAQHPRLDALNDTMMAHDRLLLWVEMPE